MLWIYRCRWHVGQGASYTVFPAFGQRQGSLVGKFEIHVFCFSGNAAFAAVVADFDGQGVPAGFDQTGRYGVMTLYVIACATGDLFSVPIHNVFIVYSARVQL